MIHSERTQMNIVMTNPLRSKSSTSLTGRVDTTCHARIIIQCMPVENPFSNDLIKASMERIASISTNNRLVRSHAHGSVTIT
jgi:hypothetical protein